MVTLWIPEFISNILHGQNLHFSNAFFTKQNNSNIYKSNNSAVVKIRGIEKWLYEYVSNQQVPLHK